MALVVVWAILAAIALVRALNPGPWVVIALCLIGIYFFVIGWVPVGRLSRRNETP
jgi:hypothetical protein